MDKNSVIKRYGKLPLILPIFGSHIKRIGYLRAILGGALMYLSIPEFIIVNITVIVVFNFLLFKFIYDLEPIRARNFVILDRHKIKGLHWFDKFNCLFCGYANGLINMYSRQIKMVSESKVKMTISMKFLFFIVFIPHLLLTVVSAIYSNILFFLISTLIGFNRVNLIKMWIKLQKEGHASHYSKIMQTILCFYTAFIQYLKSNLEQIESAFCPLKHIERRSNITPEHHKNFFERNEIDKMRDKLLTEGTVSDRKLKY